MEIEFKWEMVFGTPQIITGLGIRTGKPQTIMKITDSQKELLDSIADINYSDHAEKYYVVNNLRFKIYPILNINKQA